MAYITPKPAKDLTVKMLEEVWRGIKDPEWFAFNSKGEFVNIKTFTDQEKDAFLAEAEHDR